MANTYAYTGPGTRWAEGNPTAEDLLNIARVNADHLHEALNLLTDTVVADGLLTLPAGLVGAPSVAPTGDSNTGMWFPAADTVAISTGGVERLRVGSTGLVLGNTTLASNTITQATGAALNIVLSSAAGDDFAVDASKFVVSGDTGFIGINQAAPVTLFEVLEDTAGDVLELYIHHTDNTNAASHTKLSLITGGTSGGDPVILFGNGTQYYWMGEDNSDSDIFKISSTSQFGNEFVITPAGLVGIGDTTNANMTVGLTINQGSNTNQIFAEKGSGVAHGVTDLTETDTYGFDTQQQPNAGGRKMWGIGEAAGSTIGLSINGVSGSNDTSDTSSSNAGTVVAGYSASGAALADFGSTANVIAIKNNATTIAIWKGNGDMHITNTTLTALDGYDDAALLRAGELSRTEGIIRSKWDDAIPYDQQELKETGVLSSQGHFWNLQRLNSLQNNAIWQNRIDLEETKIIITKQAQKLVQLEERLLLKENNN
jgi:hypothetical protein